MAFDGRRDAQHRQILLEPSRSFGIDPNQNRTAGNAVARRIRPRRRLVIGRHGILDIDNDRIRARLRRTQKPLGSIARNEKRRGDGLHPCQPSTKGSGVSSAVLIHTLLLRT